MKIRDSWKELGKEMRERDKNTYKRVKPSEGINIGSSYFFIQYTINLQIINIGISCMVGQIPHQYTHNLPWLYANFPWFLFHMADRKRHLDRPQQPGNFDEQHWDWGWRESPSDLVQRQGTSRNSPECQLHECLFNFGWEWPWPTPTKSAGCGKRIPEPSPRYDSTIWHGLQLVSSSFTANSPE